MLPKISIILPTYNAELTLKDTLDSILRQTFKDFEIIIVNDGSKDRTHSIIASYHDPRIRLINNNVNKGLIYSLNIGIENASGEYIARMDADDIMSDNRLERQYEYMQQHPEIDICGCCIEIFDATHILGHQLYGVTSDEIKAELLFNSPIAHPTYFIRSKAFRGYTYNSHFKYCEDYELLSRFLMNNHRAGNLPEILLKYRISDNSQTKIGESDSRERFSSISQTQSTILRTALGIENNDYHRKLHYTLSLTQRIEKIDLNEFPIREIKKYFKLLIKGNRDTKYCENGAIQLTIGKIWLKLIRYQLKDNCKQFGEFIFSKYAFYGLKYLRFRLNYLR